MLLKILIHYSFLMSPHTRRQQAEWLQHFLQLVAAHLQIVDLACCNKNFDFLDTTIVEKNEQIVFQRILYTFFRLEVKLLAGCWKFSIFVEILQITFNINFVAKEIFC